MSFFRDLSVFLSGCLLLAGCYHAERWAVEDQRRLAPGMTTEQVRDEIGEPAQITRGDPGTPQVWLYQYRSGPSTVATIFLVVFIVGLVVLLAIGGGGGSVNFGGGWDGEDTAQFRVHFDGAERVVDVSPIEVLRRP